MRSLPKQPTAASTQRGAHRPGDIADLTRLAKKHLLEYARGARNIRIIIIVVVVARIRPCRDHIGIRQTHGTSVHVRTLKTTTRPTRGIQRYACGNTPGGITCCLPWTPGRMIASVLLYLIGRIKKIQSIGGHPIGCHVSSSLTGESVHSSNDVSYLAGHTTSTTPAPI